MRIPGAAVPLPRARPRRLSLPMTALRETPISWAICLQDRPALKQLLSRATRSVVQVIRKFLLEISMTAMLASGPVDAARLGRRQDEVAPTRTPRCDRMSGPRLIAQTGAAGMYLPRGTEPHPRLRTAN